MSETNWRKIAHDLYTCLEQDLAAHPEILATARVILADLGRVALKDVLGRLAGLLPHATMVTVHQTVQAVDPRRDTRPPASVLFNGEYVLLTQEDHRRIQATAKDVAARDVQDAWRECEWHSLQLLNISGDTLRIPTLDAFAATLPRFGTNRVAYSVDGKSLDGIFVCREYGFAFALIGAAKLGINMGITCDFSAGHFYNHNAVLMDGQVRIVQVEPQADRIIPHLDPGHHYTGRRGFGMVI